MGVTLHILLGVMKRDSLFILLHWRKVIIAVLILLHLPMTHSEISGCFTMFSLLPSAAETIGCLNSVTILSLPWSYSALSMMQKWTFVASRRFLWKTIGVHPLFFLPFLSCLLNVEECIYEHSGWRRWCISGVLMSPWSHWIRPRMYSLIFIWA